MESREVKTLLLLEAIGEEECLSQRELSRKLNISLGLVNSFINKLLIQGVFKTSKLSKNRVRYLLSPKGVLEKAELTKKYLKHSIFYYKEVKRRVAELLSILVKSGKGKIIFYGAGELCEIACVVIRENNIGNVKIIDDKKAGSEICGLEISKETILETIHFDAIIIMDFENNSLIRSHLIDKGIPDAKIYDTSLHYISGSSTTLK
jgi:DNA-binding MarR family transcriptional regulator